MVFPKHLNNFLLGWCIFKILKAASQAGFGEHFETAGEEIMLQDIFLLKIHPNLGHRICFLVDAIVTKNDFTKRVKNWKIAYQLNCQLQ